MDLGGQGRGFRVRSKVWGGGGLGPRGLDGLRVEGF
jgi:hypothetical protein